MRAIIRKMDGSYYQSMVFGYFWQNAEEMNLWDQVYIVLDEGKSKLIAQADFDMDAARWIDELSDENVWGSSGVKDGIHFGITEEESPEFEDEIVVEKYSHIPFYGAWHREWQQKYGFNLAWKNYESDDDLSIDFATT